MMMVRHVKVNGRWPLNMPIHRALRYYEEGEWEKARLASMALHIDKHDVILDIGSEEGEMSALFASWVPEGGIALMEPNPKAWPNIKLSWDANGLPDPLAWYAGFASSYCSTALNADIDEPFGKAPDWPECADNEVIGDHGFRQLAQETDTTSQITVDRFCLQADIRPTVVTMDVEGAELEVLKGAEVILEHRPRVWISVHPQFLRYQYKQTPSMVYSFMEDHGYRVIHLADDHEVHVYCEPR